jgi:hypothetical protein
MAKRKVIRVYARHKKCGHVMEPADLEVNREIELRFESDGSAILEETGRVPRLANPKEQGQSIFHMLKQAARQTRCLHCDENVVLSSEDAVILDAFPRESPPPR